MTLSDDIRASLADLRARAEEKKARRRAFQHALSEVRLEGGDVSLQAAPLFEAYVDGGISDEELGERLLALHRAR